MPRLSIALLGTFRVTLDGKPVTAFATDKTQALLAYLAVEADRPHRREALAGLLWPDQPENKARQNLRQTLSYLRQALGDGSDAAQGNHTASGYLLVTREAIQVNPNCDYELDVAAFIEQAEMCTHHRHRRLETCRPCLHRMAHMAALYQGDFLEQFFLSDSNIFEEWASLKREWLHRQVVEALFHLTNYHHRRGELELARRYAWRQVELEAWREEAHRQLMVILALQGQRSAALAQYETCRAAMAEELGVEPTHETLQIYEHIQAGRLPGVEDERARSLMYDHIHLHNLPPSPTSFVGRDHELAELADLLADPDCRLVSLTGPGGAGKTRLALQAAADQVGAFAHGVYFVPLADINQIDLVISAIAAAIGLVFSSKPAPRRQLLEHLREKDMLLVLDNLEHLLPAMDDQPVGANLCVRPFATPDNARPPDRVLDLLVEVLRWAPDVVLLATSRQRLNMQEEWVYRVDGLTFPPISTLSSEEMTLSEVDTYTAIMLFEQRARQVNRRFELSGTNAAHIARICRLVEGLPLAVELAAASTTARSCRDIAQEIEQRLDVLATSLHNVPQRHLSMRATYEHSWELLSEPERGVFQQLSVFRGGFELEAVQRITDATTIMLAALVDKSLLLRDISGRYQLHHLLRQYAAEKLDQLPQQRDAAGQRHASYYAGLLQRCETDLKGEKQAEALAKLRVESDNIRAGWEWAVKHSRYTDQARALAGLALFYDIQGHYQEGAVAFGQAADALGNALDSSSQGDLLGRLLLRQGAFAGRLGDYERARALLQAELTHLGEGLDAAFGLNHLGEVARLQGDYRSAEQHHADALKLCQRHGDDWEKAIALAGAGSALYRQADYPNARTYYQQSLDIRRELGDRSGLGRCLNDLGLVAYRLGDYAEARRLLKESLSIKQNLQDISGIPPVLNNLGLIADVAGDYPAALDWYQQSLALRRTIGERWGIALTLNNLGVVAHRMGNYQDAQRFHQQSLDICRELEDQRGVANSLTNLGLVAEARSEWDEARHLYQEALTIREAIGDRRGIGWSFYHLGALATLGEVYDQARQWLQASLNLWRELGDPWGRLFALNAWGHLALAVGDFDEAETSLREVIQHAVAQHTPAVALRALVGWAALLARRGELERAAETLGLVEQHPACEQQTRQQAEQLAARLRPRLLPAQWASAYQKGQAGTLETFAP